MTAPALAAAPLLAAPVVHCPGLACLACGGPVGCQRLHATAWAWTHIGARPPGCPGLLVPPWAEVNYLLHFTPPYRHAGHYLGFADDLPRRLRKQARGKGANLVAVALAAGCTFELVWLRLGTREDERRRKNCKDAPRLCPVCPTRPARSTPPEFAIPEAAQGVLALAGGGA